MKAVKIPQRIDDPPHLLLWSADELAPMLIGLTVGIVIGKAFICFLGGLLITNLYRRYRDSRPDGYMLHIIYWIGLLPTKGKSMINPYNRRFLP